MKNIISLVSAMMMIGCSMSNDYDLTPAGERNKRESRMTHYIHLAVGDSLGYGPILADSETFFYSQVMGTTLLDGRIYYQVTNSPVVPFCDQSVLIRQDDLGNIYTRDVFGFADAESSRETILYRTAAEEGSSWYVHWNGDSIKCNLESRSDTAETAYRRFSNCLRVRFHS